MFLAVDVALMRHPKTMRLRRLLMDPRAALYVIELWAWCSEYAKDGDITEFAPEEIEGGIGWTLDAGKLYAALAEAGFIDISGGLIKIHDWDEHQGKWIKRMEAQRTRMRELRGGPPRKTDARTAQEDELRETVVEELTQQTLPLADSAPPVRAPCANKARTVMTNQTKPNLTKQNQEGGRPASPGPAQVMIASFCDSWAEAYPGEKYAVAGKDAAAIKAILASTPDIPESWPAILPRYFATARPFYLEQRHPLWALAQNPNEFGGNVRAPPNGVAKPRDITRGWAPAMTGHPKGEQKL